MFDIEEKMNLINDDRTKILFKEVISSYQHENYRSAIVSLWSIVIADIIYKLEFLENTYGSEKAKGILEVLNGDKNNKNFFNKESDLIRNIRERLNLISEQEEKELYYLRDIRNSCAHPIIDQNNDLLLTPNKDKVRSLIRSAMEIILLKTPLISRELIEKMTEELSYLKSKLDSYINVKQYVLTRFFANIQNSDIENILQNFWRYVFNSKNEKESENVDINFNIILILFEKYNDICINCLKKNSSKFQINISFFNIDSPNNLKFEKYLLNLLLNNRCIFKELEEYLRTQIKSKILDHYSIGIILICDFISDNLQDHFEFIEGEIENNYNNYYNRVSYTGNDFYKYLNIIFEKSKNNFIENDFFNICISIYSKSKSFDKADINYSVFIENYLENFNKELILLLIKKTENNEQVCSKIRKHFINTEYYKICEKLDLLKVDLEEIEDYENWSKFYSYYLNCKNNKIEDF